MNQNNNSEAGKPEKTYGKGVRISVWRNNKGPNGSFVSFKLERRYKDMKDGTWKSSNSLTLVSALRMQALLAKAISDCGWGTFRQMLEYKTAKYGRHLIVADRWFPSSKTCSAEAPIPVCTATRPPDFSPHSVRMPLAATSPQASVRRTPRCWREV